MNASKNQQTEPRLIRRKKVQTKTGLDTSSIYAMMKNGEFPLCLNLFKRRVAWIESEIDQWIANRIKQHKAHAAMGAY